MNESRAVDYINALGDLKILEASMSRLRYSGVISTDTADTLAATRCLCLKQLVHGALVEGGRVTVVPKSLPRITVELSLSNERLFDPNDWSEIRIGATPEADALKVSDLIAPQPVNCPGLVRNILDLIRDPNADTLETRTEQARELFDTLMADAIKRQYLIFVQPTDHRFSNVTLPSTTEALDQVRDQLMTIHNLTISWQPGTSLRD